MADPRQRVEREQSNIFSQESLPCPLLILPRTRNRASPIPTSLSSSAPQQYGPKSSEATGAGDNRQHHPAHYSLFKYAYEAGLIDRPMRFGPGFARPSKKTLRLE